MRLRKKSFGVLAAAVLVCGLTGCQADIDTGQAIRETQKLAVKIENIENDAEINEIKNQDISILENQLSVLKNALIEDYNNCYITYGIIDFDYDGTDEFFAVFSQGDQGYNEIKFYSVDNDNVNELFSSSGFCRDGDTYFMYDEELSRLLIFSGYKHSYFLKNEKTEAVSNDGNVSVLFDSTWQADSPEEELRQTDTYINSSEVSADEYNNEYGIFMGKEYKNIMYIYDGKLFSGSELISGNENVYQDYLSKN